jgi:hypothetical protein
MAGLPKANCSPKPYFHQEEVRMKRNFGKKLIIGAALCCLPFSAMALEALDDSALGGVTGQAGVSIALDDVVIYMKSIADVTYIDTDGFGDVKRAGITIEHQTGGEKIITLGAIVDDTKYGITALQNTFGNIGDIGILPKAAIEARNTQILAKAQVDGLVEAGVTSGTEYDTAVAALNDATAAVPTIAANFKPTDGSTGNFTNGISPLTIDIGEAVALTQGWTYNTNTTLRNAKGKYVAGVTIGLPTVEIKTYYNTVGEQKAIKLAETAVDASVMNAGKEFITIKKTGNSELAILGGRLEIAPH